MKTQPDFTALRRKSDMLMTLKTRDIPGPWKYVEDPLVIPEEDATLDNIEGDKVAKARKTFTRV